MIILCRAAETLAASFSFKLSAFRRKKSCKLSSETTERRVPPLPDRTEQYRACGVYISTEYPYTDHSLALVESDNLVLYTRTALALFPNFSDIQNPPEPRRRTRRIFRCTKNVFYDRVSGCTWWGMDIPRGEQWDYQGYGR